MLRMTYRQIEIRSQSHKSRVFSVLQPNHGLPVHAKRFRSASGTDDITSGYSDSVRQSARPVCLHGNCWKLPRDRHEPDSEEEGANDR